MGLYGPFDPARDELWRRRVDGQLTERRYWHHHATRLVTDASIETDDPTRWLMQELYDVPEDLIVRPEATALLDGLEDRGLGLAALTNDLSRFHDSAWIERLSVLQRFDPLIDLSDLGTFKPDPAAYRHALDVLAVAPGAVLFVDDQIENVSAARQAGIPTVFFDATDVDASIESIKSVLADI
jgi:HAD superfamily hydrolase (TIGR01509 family)